jgi:hypothetical protein
LGGNGGGRGHWHGHGGFCDSRRTVVKFFLKSVSREKFQSGICLFSPNTIQIVKSFIHANIKNFFFILFWMPNFDVQIFTVSFQKHNSIKIRVYNWFLLKHFCFT